MSSRSLSEAPLPGVEPPRVLGTTFSCQRFDPLRSSRLAGRASSPPPSQPRVPLSQTQTVVSDAFDGALPGVEPPRALGPTFSRQRSYPCLASETCSVSSSLGPLPPSSQTQTITSNAFDGGSSSVLIVAPAASTTEIELEMWDMLTYPTLVVRIDPQVVSPPLKPKTLQPSLEQVDANPSANGRVLMKTVCLPNYCLHLSYLCAPHP